MLLNATRVLFADLSYVLNQLEDADYIRSLPLLGGASIGQHVRHMLEFYECLQDGLHHGKVNYDNRRRDLDLEVYRLVALARLDACLAQLPGNCTGPLLLEGDLTTTPEGTASVVTSYDRELAYNIEHCIHHMAIIKIALLGTSIAVQIPEGFGVAPSTLRHRQKIAG